MTEPVADTELDKSPHRVAAMFDSVAQRYDLTNDIASLGMDRLWRRAMVRALQPQPGQKILDLAAGTGTSSAAIARGGAEVVACDISVGMMDKGRELHPEIEFVEGNATDLPFADNSFDSATISFGLRNVDNTQLALREMARVTKPGGTLLVCEFSCPTWGPFRALYEFYLGTVMQKMTQMLQDNDSAYAYLARSILSWPDQQQLGRMIADNGWERVQYRNLAGGIVALHRASAVK